MRWNLATFEVKVVFFFLSFYFPFSFVDSVGGLCICSVCFVYVKTGVDVGS